MLPDPLVITDSTVHVQDGDSDAISLAVVDLAPGKTVRVGTLGGNKVTLTISHIESKENKGTITDRSLIRLDVRKNVEDIGETTASVFTTFAFPRAGFTALEMQKYAADVLFVLNSYASRILAGEP